MGVDTNLVLMAYIFEEDNVLLTKHVDEDLWLPVGGHLEKGEDFKTCLDREIKEETTLEARYLYSGVNKNDQPVPLSVLTRREEILLEFSAIKTEGCIELNPELSAYRWIPISEIDTFDNIVKPVKKKAKRAFEEIKTMK